MRPTKFYPAAPCNDPPSRWQATNRALGQMIRGRRSRMGPAVAIARRIDSRLHALFPQMDALCRRTCPWCPEPCCIVNTVWIDFKDLLFLHLTERPIPRNQTIADSTSPCCYLSGRGCILPRIIRPWACTLYLCATQRAALDRQGAEAADALVAAIDTIRCDRLDMEQAFVAAVTAAG